MVGAWLGMRAPPPTVGTVGDVHVSRPLLPILSSSVPSVSIALLPPSSEQWWWRSGGWHYIAGVHISEKLFSMLKISYEAGVKEKQAWPREEEKGQFWRWRRREMVNFVDDC